MDMKMVAASIILVLTVAIAGVYGLKSVGVIGNGPASNWQWGDDWGQDGHNHGQMPPMGQGPAPTDPIQQPPMEQPKPQGQITAASFEEAKELSTKHNRKIVVMFTAPWCGWCGKMKRETLQSQEVKNQMLNYVFVAINTDNDKRTGQKFGIKGLPTFVITDSTEKAIKKSEGFSDAPKFSAWLK